MLPIVEGIKTINNIERYPSKTYRLDLETNHIAGYIEDDIEAIKQSIFLMLSTERYAWLIYNWYFGVEFDTLIGKNRDYVKTEIQRRIKECLMEDDRITNVSSFLIKTEEDSATISFNVSTIYGEIDYGMEVVI